MRTAIIILLAIHGIIHLFGFLKAYGLSDFNAISQPISKMYGIIWLLAFVFFAATAAFYALHLNYWWVVGTIAIILSQILIVMFWKDARFGTALNIIFLIAIVIAYSNHKFQNNVNREVAEILDASMTVESGEVQMMALPPIVQKWLSGSGALNTDPINNVHLEQELEMMMDPQQEDWMPAIAGQYFTINPPAFHWSVDMKMNAFMDVAGRDKFENGQGEMKIKLYSIFKMANVKNEDKINQATLQRYLAETVWFPTAALSPYISWDSIDNLSARATMEFNGTKGSGIFYFDEEGNFQKFTAMRYKDVNDEQPTEWVVKALRTEKRNDVSIPVELEAQWVLDDGPWTWLKLRLTNINYNVSTVTLRQPAES